MHSQKNQELKIKYLEIGDNLKTVISSKNSTFFIKTGKIRVIEFFDEDNEQTVCFLESEDIFKPSDYSHYEFFASENTEIVEFERDFTNVEMEKGLYSSECKLNKTTGTEQINNSTNKSSNDNNNREISAEKQTENCLKALINNYAFDESFLKSVNIDGLEKKLKQKKIECTIKKLNWVSILSSDFPFIIEDKNNALHFITGRKGNALLERYDSSIIRFLPDVNLQKETFQVLKIVFDSSKKRYKTFSLSNYLKLFLNNPLLTSQLVLSSVIVQIFTLGLPLFYMVIFDRAFGRQNIATLDVMSFGLLMVMVFDLAVKVVRSFIFSNLLEEIEEKTVEAFLRPVFNAPLSGLKGNAGRGLAGAFQELSKINFNICQAFLVYSFDIIFSIFLIALLFIISVKMAFISLIPVIPMVIMALWTTPTQKKRALESMQLARKNQLKLSEAIESIETFRSLNATNYAFNDFIKSLKKTFKQDFLARFDKVNTGNVQSSITNIGMLSTLYIGAHEVFGGVISYGSYLAFNMMSRNFLSSIQKMLMYIQIYQETAESIKQLKIAGFDEAESSEENDNYINLLKCDGDINFNGVYFKYSAESKSTLENINLEIKAGQKIVITGKSGSGKSTLIRLLQGLYTPNSGYITLDSFNISDIQPENLRSLIGTVVQKPAILEGTLGSNLTIGNPNASAESVIKAASMVQLDKVLVKYPEGLATKVLPTGSNLSSSQISQIAIARVLLLNPSVLVIDDVFSHMDISLKEAAFSMILERYKNSTCILVTDYLPVHKKADRIIVMNEGSIVEDGNFDNLLAQKGYYYHLNFISEDRLLSI